MLTLRTLGSLSLRNSEGTEIASVLSQPKRCALLVYLALARPQGLQRRDTILTLFWPERPDVQARNSLSQSLSFLRHQISERLILRRGTEEIGLAPGALKSDVEDFEAAVTESRWEEALDHYQGDFLRGFHVGNAWGFEEWVEAERDRLREMAAGAAWALAQEQIEAAALVKAERTAQKALGLVWTDETPVRRFMESLARAGDRASALNLYKRFCTLLWEELALEPSAKTQEVAEAVRNGRVGGGAERTSAPVTEPSLDEGPPISVTAEGGKRRMLLGMAAVMILVLASALGVYSAFFRTGPSILPGNRVVVFPFENITGDPELDYLETTVSRYVTSRLGWVEEISVVSADLSQEAFLIRGENVTPRDIALKLDADIQVTGWINPAGDELLFEAEVTPLAKADAFISVSGRGPADPREAMAGVTELLERLIGALAISVREETTTYWVQRPPPSYEAALAYFRGDQNWFEGDFPTAALHFQEAFQMDTTFLFALMNVVSSLQKIPDWVGAEPGLVALKARRERLTPKERYWLDWLDFTQNGDLKGILEAGRFELGRDPRDQVTMSLVGGAALGVGRFREAVGAFEAIDPDYPAVWAWPLSWNEMAQAHHLLGDFEEELDIARAAIRFSPDLELLFLRSEARALTGLGRLDEIEGVLGRAERLETTWSTSQGDVLRGIAGDLARYGFQDESRSVAERALAWHAGADGDSSPLDVAESHFLTGDLDETVELLRSIIRQDPGNLTAHGMYGVALAIRGEGEASDAEAVWLRDLDRPFMHGRDTLWRSAVRAHLGQVEEAVRLLVHSHREGRSFPTLHFSPWLEPLWGNYAYEEFLSPKG